MAIKQNAPANTVWGTESSNSNGAGKIGISVTVENTSQTNTRITMDVYYWSKYAVDDGVNAFDVCVDGSNWYTALKNQSIVATSNSAWSTSNQFWIGYWTIDRTRGTSNESYSLGTAFYNIEYGGGSGYCHATYTVPARPSYTITYNANGGTNAPSPHSYYYGYNTSLSTQVPTRFGYNFLGWSIYSTATTASYSPGQSWSGTNDTNYTLYAVWEQKKVTITYDANGGTNAPSPQTVAFGTNQSLFTTIPTRKDYLFLGWSAEKTATEPTYAYKEGYNVYYAFYSDTKLYAVWKLDYIKPRVNNLSVVRVDGNGEKSETGTAVKISFDYATDRDGVAYAVYRKLPTEQDSAYTLCDRVTLSEKEGSVSAIVKNTVFSTELTYDIHVLCPVYRNEQGIDFSC